MKTSTIMMAIVICSTIIAGSIINTKASGDSSYRHTALRPDTAEKFTISVGYHENRILRFIQVETAGDNTVGELKTKAEAQANIQCNGGRVVYKKKRLDDDKKISEFDIHAGDTCFLACIK
ncbi:MAG TPA: ubiquitin-like protein [Chitinophaga sp.]|uniref:ubiquitin-like protein n=1 Tax=Chitinophaga sp. TaxID=1869181 RepID=UPI002B73587F|nr:ubiquitin-like protein [Chitinophaga sp.]HVI44991.1 ubiquitin-like protein [Chitinophaga sp.]